MNISVQPGKTLALVGPSGCGKSTVVSLIERFYDPSFEEGGKVEMDNRDLRQLNIQWLRSKIGLVSQEPVLFDGSIADNIRYGDLSREISDEEVEEAARSANIHDFITSLPMVSSPFSLLEFPEEYPILSCLPSRVMTPMLGPEGSRCPEDRSSALPLPEL